MDIYTIGHSTRTLDEFITILKKYKIKCLVDVRSYPGSRRYPHFNKEFLGHELKSHGIKYIHIPELGGRRHNKPSYKMSIKVAAFASYAEYMLTEEFEKGYEELIEIAKNCKTAFMCSESLYWRCHRRMISDKLTYDGWNVYHLGLTHPELHEVWNISRLNKKGQVIYDQ